MYQIENNTSKYIVALALFITIYQVTSDRNRGKQTSQDAYPSTNLRYTDITPP